MALDQATNFAETEVATTPSPANSGTTLSVASGDGAKFPAAPFNVSVKPIGGDATTETAEIVRVTSKGTGDNWTITRTQEGTSARSIIVGDKLYFGFTKKTRDDIQADLDLLAAAWSSWTPAWTSLSNPQPAIGNGTITGRYWKYGKTVHFNIKVTFGSTSTFGTSNWYFSLPFTAQSYYSFGDPIGHGFCDDVAIAGYEGVMIITNTTKVEIRLQGAATNSTSTVLSTFPFTFGNGDIVNLSGTYEAA